jgi:hypothetical protein
LQASQATLWDTLQSISARKDIQFKDNGSKPWNTFCTVTVLQALWDGAHPPCPSSTPNANITCFGCGAKSHYASDIKCPNYGNSSGSQYTWPQLQAVRADDDDEHLTTSSHSNSVQDREDLKNSSYEGSQFDDKTDCENDSSDSTSTVSAEQEAYQRPMYLDTSFSEVDSDDDYIVYNCTVCISKAPVQKYLSCSSLRKKEDWLSQSSKGTACLSTWVTINSVCALTLFDSGSTTDSVSLDFTQVMDLRLFQVMKQVALQLGCVGSRGSINYGVCPNISFMSIQEHPYYLDIVNIDRYNCILSTPFMHEHNIMLDFGISAILIHSQKVLALSGKEEASLLAGHWHFPTKTQQAETEGTPSPWLHLGPIWDNSLTKVKPSNTIKHRKTQTSSEHDIRLHHIVLWIVDQSLLTKDLEVLSQKETRKVSQQETLLVMLIDDNAKLS